MGWEVQLLLLQVLPFSGACYRVSKIFTPQKLFSGSEPRRKEKISSSGMLEAQTIQLIPTSMLKACYHVLPSTLPV